MTCNHITPNSPPYSLQVIYASTFAVYYGPGVDSASNRNEYQYHFLGVKAAGV